MPRTVALWLALSSMALADPPKPPAAPPTSPGALAASIQRGSDYLVKTQNADGSWGSPRWTGGVDSDPLTAQHSFCTATTALCIEALLSTGDESPAVRQAIERGTTSLVRELPRLQRADSGNVPNVWAHGYGIQTLAALHRRLPPGDTRLQYEALMRSQCERLAHYETVHGGWFYYASGMQKPNAPSCSFVDAAILVSLHRGKSVGVEPPKAVVERALSQLRSMRKPDASFIYSQTTPGSGGAGAAINGTAGSLGRS